MFEFIGGIFSFAFGMVKMGLSLAWGAVQFLVGLLSGIFSLILSLGGLILAGGLVLLAVNRRKEYKKRRAHPYEEGAPTQERVYDVDKEEFTSFYDQFRTQDNT